MYNPYENSYSNYGAGFPQPSPIAMSLKEKIQYSLLGIIVVGGAIIIGRKAIQKAQRNNEQSKTLEDGSAPTFAKQIKMAFDNDGWWGTNKEALRTAIQGIQSKSDFRKVMSSYQKLYNSSLLGDMQQELKSSEYNELLAIVAAKPDSYNPDAVPTINVQQYESWAKRLKAAFDITYGFIPGTDEPAIKAVFLEMHSQQDFARTALVYKSLYGNELLSDLKNELEFWEYDPMMQLIYSKPKA